MTVPEPVLLILGDVLRADIVSNQRLAADGAAPEIVLAVDVADLETRLGEQRPDVVLLELAAYESLWPVLQRMAPDSVPALLLILEADRDLPELPGVWDYLVRSQLNPQRLRQTVGNLRQQQRLRRQLAAEQCRAAAAEQTVQQGLHQKALLQALLDNLPHAAWMKDCDGRFIAVNAAFGAACGQSPEAVVGKTDMDVSPPDAARLYRQEDLAIMASGQRQRFEEPFYGPDGHQNLRWLDTSKTPIYAEDGTLIGTVGVGIDITERRHLEQELRASQALLTDVLNSSGACITSFRLYPDGSWQYNYYSPGSQLVYGYRPEEMEGDPHLWQSRVLPEDFERAVAPGIRAVMEGRTSGEIEFRFRHKDGSLRWIRESCTARWEADKNYWVVTTVGIDITKRKRTQAALEESEARFRAIFNQAAVGMAQVAMDGRIMQANRQFCEFVGYGEAELQQMTYAQFSHPEDLAVDDALMAQLVPGEIPAFTIEKRFIHSSGEARWSSLSVALVRDAEGEPLYDVAVIQDICDRKQLEAERQRAEQALAQSEAQYRSLIENASEIIYTRRVDGTLTFISPQVERILGYSPEEVLHRNLWELVHPEDVGAIADLRRQLMDMGGSLPEIAVRVRHKQGHWHWLRTNVTPIVDGAGQVLEVQGIAIDIHQQKQIELALQESNARFEAIFDYAAVGINLAAIADGRVLSANPAFCEFLGYSQAELRQMSYAEYTHPEDLELDVGYMQRLVDGEISHFTIEKRFLHKSGQVFWGNMTVSLVRDSQGEPLYDIAVVEDICDRKRSEAALRQSTARLQQSEARRQLALELTQTGSWELDIATGEAIWSDSQYRLVGLEPGQQPSGYPTWRERIHPEDLEWVEAAIAQAVAKQGELNLEHRVVYPGGTVRWILIKGRVHVGENQAVRMAGVTMDITRRKQAELDMARQLQETTAWRNRYAAAGRAGNQLLYDFDAAGGESTWSETVTQLLGRSMADMKAVTFDTWVSWVHPEDRPQVQQALDRLTDLETPQSFRGLEYRLQRKDGQYIWVEDSNELILDAEGRLSRIIGNISDISTQKRTANILQQLLAGTATVTGEAFFPAMVEQIAQTLNIPYVSVLERKGEVLEAITLYQAGVGHSGFCYLIDDTPCQIVLREGTYYCPHDVQAHFPADESFAYLSIESYLGVVLTSSDGRASGVLCIFSPQAIEHPTYAETILRIFAARAAAELERVQAQRSLQQLNRHLEATVAARTLALSSSEQELRTLFNLAPVGIMQADAESYRFTKVNQRCVHMFGYSREQLLQGDFTRLTHPEDLELSRQQLQRLYRGEAKSVTFEKRYVRQDGAVIWANVSIKLLRQADDTPAFLLAVVEDITERKQAELALRESETRFRTLFEGTPNPIQGYDAQRRVIFWNTASEHLYGYSREEAMGRPLEEMIIPDTLRDGVVEGVKAWLADEIEPPPIGEELCLWDKDRQPVEVYSTHVRLNGQRGPEMYCIDVDISELKQVERALRESEERFRQITENISEVFWLTTPDSEILYVSPAYEKVWGRSRENLTLDTVLDTVHPEERTWVQAIWQRLYDQDARDVEYRIVRPDGAVRWIRDRAFPVLDPQGQVQRIAGIAEDITERRQAEVLLRQTNAELEARVAERTADLTAAAAAAEAANRAKRIFLANMSHELRTPLNAILGFSQILAEDTALPAHHQEELAIINRSGEHLLMVINDILDMSKIEAGQITLNPVGFRLSKLLERLEDMLSLRAEEKGLTFHIYQDSALPDTLRGDLQKLRQVLINLLGNAIKFTQQGSVYLAVSQGFQPENNSQVRLRFEVGDTGTGIAPEDLERLFQPFTQAVHYRGAQEGTGLGLSISRQYVQLMGSELAVTSELGEGTTFSFELDATAVDAAIVAEEGRQNAVGIVPHQPRYRILIAEDNPASRRLMEKLLTSLGLDIRSAVDGQDTVTLWRSWQPHLIWMDMRMPEMDGYEATRQIREEESRYAAGATATALPTKIIALTAEAFDGDRAKVLASGCDDFVKKPISKSILTQALTTHLGLQFVYAEEASPAPETAALSAEALQVLPSPWLQEFLRAATQLQAPRLIQLIEQLPAEQQSLAQLLTERVNDFDYETLIQTAQGALEAAS